MRARLGSLLASAAAVLVVTLAALPARAAAPAMDDARAHFAAGEGRFRAGDFRGAIEEFRIADRLVPSPFLTYNIALCNDRLGNAGEAVRGYRRYLEQRPDAPNRALVESRLAALSAPVGDQLAVPRQGEPPPAPVAPPPAMPAPAPVGDGLAAPTAPPAAGRPYDDVFARQLPAPGSAAPGPLPAPAPAPLAASPPMGEAEQAPAPAPLAPSPEQHKDGPIYSKWYFWAVVGVGAVIVIDVAAHAGSHSSTTTTTHAANGLVLFHF
jgi:hypothetical protein